MAIVRIKNIIFSHTFQVVVLALIYVAVTIYVSIHLLHDSYQSSAFDLGIFAQTLKYSLQGDLLYATPLGLSQLALHFSPVLLLLIPVYWLFPHVQTLLVCQALLLGLSGILVYRLCRVNKLSHRIGLFVEFLFFINPLLWGVAMFDFHEVAFAIPAILALLLGIQTGKRWLIITGLIIALTTKEDVIMLIGLFAVGRMLYLLWRERKLSYLYLTVFIAALAAYGIAIGVSIIASEGQFPRILTYGTIRYEYIKLPPAEAFRGAMTALFGAGSLSLLYSYLASLGYLPLFSLTWSFPALILLLANALSTCPGQHTLNQSSATALPFLFMGLIAAIVWLKDKLVIQKIVIKPKYIIYLIIFAVIFTSIQFIFSNTRVEYAKLPRSAEAVTNQVLAMIPDGVTVTTTNNVFPHICDRTIAYLPWWDDKYAPIEHGNWGFPEKDTEYVIIDRVHDGGFGTLEFILKKQPEKYELIAKIDGVQLYRLKQP
jgi:uncharacterized membrane protein